MASTHRNGSATDSIVFPPFDELPVVPAQPQGSLWNFFDKNGKKDELGTLNLLTRSVVLEASQEIKFGYHVQLDWSLDNLEFPGLGRRATRHVIKDMTSEGFIGLDDEIRMNTQISSQWDSLKHWSIQDQGQFYNGVDMKTALGSPTNGIHSFFSMLGIPEFIFQAHSIRQIFANGEELWAEAYWLTGWWEIHNTTREAPSPIQTYAIPVSEIIEVLKWQGTETKQGDIFLIRTGYVRWHEQADTTTRRDGTHKQSCAIGVANTMETVRWLYDKHFAAVASDTLSFEVWPYPKECAYMSGFFANGEHRLESSGTWKNSAAHVQT